MGSRVGLGHAEKSPENVLNKDKKTGALSGPVLWGMVNSGITGKTWERRGQLWEGLKYQPNGTVLSPGVEKLSKGFTQGSDYVRNALLKDHSSKG